MPSFPHNEQRFFPNIGRKRYVSQLERTAPSRHIGFLQGVEYLPDGIVLCGSVVRGVNARECIQFFIVIVYDFGIGLQQRLPFAHEMLAATTIRTAVGCWLLAISCWLFGSVAFADLKKDDNDCGQCYEQNKWKHE